MMRNQKFKNNVMLVLTALIWGSAFVAQSVGMDYIGPFTFNSLRCFLGGIVLLPVIWVMGRKKKTEQAGGQGNAVNRSGKTLWIGGLFCGLALAVASSLQQIGLVYTSAGKAGFITALYILIVPVLGIFLGRRAGGKTWAGVGLAVVGMYFLCMKEGFSIAYGDVLMIICAFVFSLHILIIDYFSPKVDGVKLSCIQFFICGILCAVPMFASEKPALGSILDAYLPLLYAGGSLLRCCLYAADHCTKKYGPHGGFAYSKPGIRICRAYRLADYTGNTFCERAVWVCPGVCRNYSGTASGEEPCVERES